MTQEEKRLKIAEACGWTHIEAETWTQGKPGGIYGYKPIRPKFDPCRRFHIPDYFGDLNACHEMEKQLTDDQWDKYCDRLGGSLRHCASATAAQRAEAFGLTLNLWEAGQ